MKRKTVRKEIIEEFDENGQLKSRTTIEETEEEDDTCKTSSSREFYWDAATSNSGVIAPLYESKLTYTNASPSTELEGQVTICEYCNGEANKYESYGR